MRGIRMLRDFFLTAHPPLLSRRGDGRLRFQKTPLPGLSLYASNERALSKYQPAHEDQSRPGDERPEGFVHEKRSCGPKSIDQKKEGEQLSIPGTGVRMAPSDQTYQVDPHRKSDKGQN